MAGASRPKNFFEAFFFLETHLEIYYGKYSTVPNNRAGKIYIFSFEKHGGRCLLETIQLFYFSETSWLVNYEGLLNYFFVFDLCKTIVPIVVSFLL